MSIQNPDGTLSPTPCPEKLKEYRARKAKEFAESSQKLDKSLFKVMCEHAIKQQNITYKK